jgi:aminobenzoyl-glutamate utilization protein B
MATPIAHKGVTAGAKVVAMTVLDFLIDKSLLPQAKTYFNEVQQKETTYRPMITPNDPPPITLNTDIMRTFRPQLEKFYYDETKYDSYLEQLGIEYPRLKTKK